MNLTPISLAEANQFVADHHRHHKPVVSHKFSMAVEQDEEIVGVAITRGLRIVWTEQCFK